MNDLERLAVVERQFRRRPQAYRGNVSEGELKFILFLVSTAGSGRDDRAKRRCHQAWHRPNAGHRQPFEGQHFHRRYWNGERRTEYAIALNRRR